MSRTTGRRPAWRIRDATEATAGRLIGRYFPDGAAPGRYRFDVCFDDAKEQSNECLIERAGP